MVVLTFSGPAVADAQPLELAATVVARQAGPRAVVVPALAGIPERLDQMLRFARDSRLQAARALAGRVAGRHRDLVRRAAPDFAVDVIATIDAAHAELERLMTAATGAACASHELHAAVHATGPVLSSAIVAAALRQANVAATCVDATRLFVVDTGAPNATPLLGETVARVERQLAPILQTGGVPVLAGGVAATLEGTIASMGADGVMLSAAIVAAAIGARELQVWTDGDGVLAADPSLIPAALFVPQLSFAEAMELARAGAKGLDAAALELAASQGTSMVVRNARRPDAPGTLINAKVSAERRAPAALAYRRGAVALQFSSWDGRAPAFMRRILDLSRQWGEEPFVAPVSGTAVTVAFGQAGRADRVAEAAREFAAVTRRDDVALVSAVGDGLAPNVAADVLEALEHITVHAYARHASGRSITMLLDDADAADAMKRLYERFFSGREPATAAPVEKGRES
jgi:aspartate kinase